jgi:hypothetical protein
VAALGLIQGVRITHDIQGGPGIGVEISGPAGRDTVIIDPSTYKIIGDRVTSALPGGGWITVVDMQLWQAYYDAAGHRL